MESIITIDFLKQGCDELQNLAQMHDLPDRDSLICGAAVTWQSTDALKERVARFNDIWGYGKLFCIAIAVLPYPNQSPLSIISQILKQCVCQLSTMVQSLKKSSS